MHPIRFGISRLKVKMGRKNLFLVLLLAVSFSTAITGQPVLPSQSSGTGITSKKFYSSFVDKDNVVWFLTEKGIVSFDGIKWVLQNQNPLVSLSGIRGIAYNVTSTGQELWIASPEGATSATLPIGQNSGITTFNPGNSGILSNNVFALAIGKEELKWIGTDKGISAYYKGKWLSNNYDDRYSESIFSIFPITSMVTSSNGDSLYIGTRGSGVMRVYRNEVDAVSGASEYMAWGPILMPSDSVYCIHITKNGVQWFGTDKGVASHTGYKTLEGWIVYTKADGLADDFVQAICSDKPGNIYFGTKNGLSVFDGTKWKTYTTTDGLPGNNILTLAVDRNDCIWIGTDNGVACLKDGKFTSFR